MSNDTATESEQDYKKMWDAKKKEMEAQAEQLSAEQRMKYNDGLDDFSKEFDAATDWSSAKWDEMSARVSQWWNDMQSDKDDS